MASLKKNDVSPTFCISDSLLMRRNNKKKEIAKGCVLFQLRYFQLENVAFVKYWKGFILIKRFPSDSLTWDDDRSSKQGHLAQINKMSVEWNIQPLLEFHVQRNFKIIFTFSSHLRKFEETQKSLIMLAKNHVFGSRSRGCFLSTVAEIRWKQTSCLTFRASSRLNTTSHSSETTDV